MREKILFTFVMGVGLSTLWTSTAWAQSAPSAPTAPSEASTKTPAPSAVPAGTWANPGAPAARSATPTAGPAPAAPPAATARPVEAESPTADGPAPETRRKARVSFEADQPGAVLESDVTDEGRTAPWYVVCEAPCTRMLSPNGSYRVSGSGYHSSRPFRFPEDQSAVRVHGEMHDSSVATPMALSIVGGVLAGVGLLLVSGGVAREVDNRNGETLIISGAAVGGAGAVIGTVGVVMLLVKSQDTESKALVTF